MATQQSTIDFVIEQMTGAGAVTAKKMFGEYGLFLQGKMVALVCDDELFVKITVAGQDHAGSLPQRPPYAGAKPCFFLSGERCDDREWLSRLIAVTAAELPLPKKKMPRRPS
ncbi:TfoX/Sxy family protein [Paraburkholderia oxyphila]|uniref:TfoX/Sxy family protein n=1 Tax=Paraburkholderia oxyphila TaxID=614212 RepID=UPI00047FA760|nr:TfoX/Sxy family protein [Paraburkholderia oxyphila]